MIDKSQYRKAKEVREIEHLSMAEHKPSKKATEIFKRKPYQTVSVGEYVKKLKG